MIEALDEFIGKLDIEYILKLSKDIEDIFCEKEIDFIKVN